MNNRKKMIKNKIRLNKILKINKKKYLYKAILSLKKQKIPKKLKMSKVT